MATAVPENATGWLSVEFGNWTSMRLDSNTWLNYTRVKVNGKDWLLLYYVEYINETHRLFVITMAEVENGGYGRVFTWANYWFKDKTVYFGDWVVVEGNFTLSQYYALLSRAVDRLAKKWQASDKQYKPQAYPQISQALMKISRAVAGTDIDTPLKRGYALVTDIKPVIVYGLIAGITSGVVAAYTAYQATRDLRRATICGVWAGVHGFITAIIPTNTLASVGLKSYWLIRGSVGGALLCR
jgi:hypothetical protein